MGLGSDENLSYIQLRDKIIDYLERFYCSAVEETQRSGNVLVQFWAANIVTREEGSQYCELTTVNQQFYLDPPDDTRLLSYRNHVVARRVRAGQEEDECNDEGQELLGITGRVFRTKRVEVSPRISHYSTDEYPQRDFALSCGIQATLCLPLFATNDSSGHPNGIIELVFTSEEGFHRLKPFIYCFYSVYSTLPMPEVKTILRSNIFHISIPPDCQIPPDVLNEIDHVLTEVSETFRLPLAQCWVDGDRSVGDYTVINHKSSLDYDNVVPWCKFKKACSQLWLNDSDGLVGRTFMSQTPFFCSDITKLSIKSYPLAHYIGNCGSIGCFTICLHNYITGNKDYVIEFFLPHEEINSHCPESLLNSLFETLEHHFKTFVLASGVKLGEEISVKVIDSVMHYESESFKIGHPRISFPRQEVPQHERGVQTLSPSAWESIWSTTGHSIFTFPILSPLGSPKQLDQNAEVIEASGSSSNSSEADLLIEEASTKCIEPQSLSYRSMELLPRDKIIQDKGESIDIDASNLERTSEDAVKHKEHIVCPEKEECPVEDVGCAITTKSPPLSSQTKKYLPRQEGKEDTTVLNPLAKRLMLEDALQIRNKGLTLGIENAERDIHFVNKTCAEVMTDRENNSEDNISFESLTKHFGRPLDDAAKSFGVSRSTFKRVCRDHGIKRWQSRKRRMDKYISSKLERNLINEEPSKRNFYCSGVAPVEHTAVVTHTSQNMNKMTVKATYNGLTIKFELSDLSGIAELQDNVIERLQVERKCFSIKYQDDEGDWILIACDKDVRECINMSRSLEKTTIKMIIDPPINHYAP